MPQNKVTEEPEYNADTSVRIAAQALLDALDAQTYTASTDVIDAKSALKATLHN